MDWADTPLGRGKRDRCVAGPVPAHLPLLDADHRALLHHCCASFASSQPPPRRFGSDFDRL